MGRVVACPGCGSPIETPFVATVLEEPILATAIPDPPSNRQIWGSPRSEPARERIAPTPRARPQSSPPSMGARQLPPVDEDPDVQRQRLDFERQSQSAAGNPGRIRLNILRYVWSFPRWTLGLGFFIVAGIGLAVFVHPAWILIAFSFAGMLYLYWKRQIVRFVAGCVNPAQIVSLDPPRVAVLANLSSGFGPDVPALKILDQPLHRMLRPAVLAVGQRLAAVALYRPDLRHGASHWIDFDPIVVNTGAASLTDVERVESTISESDWRELQAAVNQLPSPAEPGLYCVAEPREYQAGVVAQVLVLFAIRTNLDHNPQQRRYLQDSTIPAEILASLVESSGGKLDITDAFALLQGFSRREGIILTDTHVKVVCAKGYTEFLWQSLAGVLGHRNGFEFVLRSGERLAIPGDCLWDNNVYALEKVCREVMQLGEPRQDEADA